MLPARVERGRYRTPTGPGGGAQLLADSLRDYAYPDGPMWTGAAAPP